MRIASKTRLASKEAEDESPEKKQKSIAGLTICAVGPSNEEERCKDLQMDALEEFSNMRKTMSLVAVVQGAVAKCASFGDYELCTFAEIHANKACQAGCRMGCLYHTRRQ